MRRSEINAVYREASDCFQRHGWHLPPSPRWDITDFGLGNFNGFGLTLVNLAEEPEYCEKLMYARKDQKTPAHTHHLKKEDIICRNGLLAVRLWNYPPSTVPGKQTSFAIRVNGTSRSLSSGGILRLRSGERVTICPGIFHEFWPEESDTILGEVSTTNDDLHDNLFDDPGVGRFPGIEEDEPPAVHLCSEGQWNVD